MSKEWPQAAPCGGVIFHKNMTDAGLPIFLSERKENMTEYSLFGGFAECKDFLKQPIGYVHDKRIEIYRECEEEIGTEFTEIYSESEFIEISASVANIMIRTSDANKIHDALYLSINAKDQLLHHFKTMDATEEQMPPVEVLVSFDDKIDLNAPLQAPYDGSELAKHLVFSQQLSMHHKHEVNAIALLLRSLYVRT